MGMNDKIGINAGPNMIELHHYMDNDVMSVNANFIEYFFGANFELEDGTSIVGTKIYMIYGNHSFYVRESYYTVKDLIDNLKG